MAVDLAATMLTAMRAEAPNFDKNEQRVAEYGAFAMFANGTGLIPVEWVKKAETSTGREYEVPVLKRKTFTVVNSRSCTAADTNLESALQKVTFKTYAASFAIAPHEFDNNSIGYERAFRFNIESIARALAAEMDKDALAAIEAVKSQVFKTTLSYTESSDVIQVPYTMSDVIFGDAGVMMRANDFQGRLNILGEWGTLSLANKLNHYGKFNEKDLTLEHADKLMYYTGSLTNAGQKQATFYAVEDGNVQLLTRQSRPVNHNATSGVHRWEKVRIPYIPFEVGVHFQEVVKDLSARNGAASADQTCDILHSYEISVDVAFVTAYNSDVASNASPFIKFEVAKDANNGAAAVVITNTTSNPVNTKEVGA